MNLITLGQRAQRARIRIVVNGMTRVDLSVAELLTLAEYHGRRPVLDEAVTAKRLRIEVDR